MVYIQILRRTTDLIQARVSTKIVLKLQSSEKDCATGTSMYFIALYYEYVALATVVLRIAETDGSDPLRPLTFVTMFGVFEII